ncbi:HK97 gp10 family phage protein [Peptostreptococcus sp. D1]|uniref:HK97 gp10 family phage protein n=1 Tax=Peptostreptococcus sp. D1 TaxID=72304 RepID=UPI0008EBDCD9|nr:HK97 gp10 family phage protein [Peptostreptococcus sp. D1]SFE38199.1 Bacteriophage HK97-gp10, putative tail-component [Peptostreptococcus sp. D1]
MSFEFEGMDELIKRLENIEKKIPEEFDKLKMTVATEILEDVVENTPVNKNPKAKTAGNLRRGWKIRDLGDSVEIYNDVQSKGEYYAWDVEYGHRTRAGMGLKPSKRRRKSVVGDDGKILFVPGKFMLRNAMKVGKETLEKEGKRILDEITGGK